MRIARHQDIIAIRTEAGKVVGFHSRNLQVALLDDEAWMAIQAPALASDWTPALRDSSARDEIETWNAEVDPRVSDENLGRDIRSLTINIAQICNLKCSYCAAGGDGSYGDPTSQVDLSTIYDQIRSFLHDIPARGTFRITFLGGEPLVAPEAIRSIHRFAKLQTAGRNIHLRFDIVTNGTLVTPEVAELLASMNCHVTISLDGPPEINDRNRPLSSGRGSTARVLRGIANLRAVHSRLGSLRAGAVFGRHHTGVVSTWEFLSNLGFDSMKFDFAAEANDTEVSLAYADELIRTADLAWAKGGEMELRRISNFDSIFSILDSQKRRLSHCGAGKNHLQADSRGRLFACQWFVGEPTEQLGVGASIDHAKREAFADPLIEKNDCGRCWARYICGGGCMYVNKTKTGSKHAKDGAYCSRTRNMIAKGVEYYAEARS